MTEFAHLGCLWRLWSEREKSSRKGWNAKRTSPVYILYHKYHNTIRATQDTERSRKFVMEQTLERHNHHKAANAPMWAIIQRITQMATLPNPNTAAPIYPIVRNEAGELVHQTPEVFHKDFIKGETPTAKLMRDLLGTVSNSFARLNAKRHNQSSNYEAEARDGLASIADAIGKARAIADAEVKSFEDRLIEKANFKPIAANEGFVVGTFGAFRPEERVEAIGKLIEQGDGPSLATLHKVSDVFTGLSSEVKATIKTRLYKHVDPAGYAALRQAEANRDRITKADVAYTYEAPKFKAPLYSVKPANPEAIKSVGG